LVTVSIPTLSYQISFPGGDTQAVANFEYRIPIAPHVSASLFADIGATGALRHDQLQLNSIELFHAAKAVPADAHVSGGEPDVAVSTRTNFKPRSTGRYRTCCAAPYRASTVPDLLGVQPPTDGADHRAQQTQFLGTRNLANPTNPLCDQSKGITTNCYDKIWDTFDNGLSRQDFFNSVISPVPNGLSVCTTTRRRRISSTPYARSGFTVSRTF